MKKNKQIKSSHEADSLLACVEIGKLLTSTVNLNEIQELIMEKISLSIHAENWSLLLKNESTEDLTFEIVVSLVTI